MKAGLAASVYAAAIAKSQGLLAGKTVYVSGTVDEEYCDGEGLAHLLEDAAIRPDFGVICEPSANTIATGHKGKAQVIIRTQGVSAHGSAPEQGVNAVYEMAEIIQRVEQLNRALMQQGGRQSTLVLSRISSTGVSLNAVPSACEIYLDRRMVVGETAETIRGEMERLVAGKNASWELGSLERKTWTGQVLSYAPFHLAWEIDRQHPLVRAFAGALGEETYHYWDFSTNAVALVRLGVPTVGFGPGDPQLAHRRDERCAVEEIVEACQVYTGVIGRL
jgi:putative selenium metabolism hydrolase